MIILLDTSTPVCKLILVDTEARHHSEWQADRQLAHGLLTYLRDQLAVHQAEFHTITGIGVMKGPGSFTGLRIGLTVANTLAQSLAIPIVGETGGDWQGNALARLNRGENDQIVMPEYGTEAHITQQRK